jgi:hypothetical protein
MAQKTYRQTIIEWQREREESIRRENGWLALAGLFWLKPGRNSFGSDPNSEIRLPDRAPALVGYFDYEEKTVSLKTAPDQKVKVNDKLTDSAVLQPDIADRPSFITLQDLRLVVIQRGNKMGVRMWDNQSEARRTFPPRTFYEIDEKFRLTGTLTLYETPKMAFFPDLSGEKTEFPLEGCLILDFEGRSHRLDVNKEDDGVYFVRFWDPTARDETYPTGRDLKVEVDSDGRAFIDFNRAYNPPCAFTEYATCVFAPEQNHLDFRVTAGEMHRRQKH